MRQSLSNKIPYVVLLCVITCILAASICFTILFAAPVCDRNASDASSLSTQYAAAANGQTICLATGNYGTWTGGSKSVTITATEGNTATIALDFNNGDSGITIDNLTITTGSIVNSANNITIRNSVFTGILLFNDVYNSNILLENNTHNNIEFIDGNPAGRISFPYGDGVAHSGVVIRNSVFRGGSSDGIQTGVGVNIINNEFDNIQENGHPTAHTDSIQLIGAYGSVVRGNYVHDGATGIVAYDGVSNVLIEHNIVTTDVRPEAIELYSDVNSIIQHNTLHGSIYLDHKPADPVGTGTIIKNNIASSIVKVGGSSAAEQTHNLLAQGGGDPGDFAGTPTYIGGSHPTSYNGYRLANGSSGKSAASDTGDIGITIVDPPAPDTTAPEVELTTPADTSTIQSTVPISASATDNIGIAGVTFKYGTTTIGSEDTSYPYTLNWNTAQVSNGQYTLTAIARDSSGNTTISNGVVVTVDNTGVTSARSIWNDATVPAIIDGADTGAVELGLKFRSEVAGRIKGVRFYKAIANTGVHTGTLWSLDGTALRTVTFDNETASGWQEALFSSPYTINANTTYMISYHTTAGHYSVNSLYFSSSSFDNAPLSAIQDNGIDGRNGMFRYGPGGDMPNQNFNASNYWVDVVFEEPDAIPPSSNISSPTNNAHIRGPVDIEANANDNIGVVGVQFKRGCPASCTNINSEDVSGPYITTWDTTQVSDGEYMITATARDAAGNSTTATNVAVYVDNTAPNTSITGHPADPSNIANPSFTFTANESATFECKLDGQSYGACTSPRSYTGLASGTHAFSVRAIDDAGNVDVSPQIFTWDVDVTAPVVSITQPASGIVSGSTVIISATGSDNRQLAGIQFKLDGINIASEDTTAPYSIQWDSVPTNNGAHTISAVARDAVGNITVSAGVNITVNNPSSSPSNSPADTTDTHESSTVPSSSSPDQSYTSRPSTNAAEINDSSSPIIKDVTISAITKNSAQISWKSSEPASAYVIYYKDSSDKKTITDTGLSEQHSMTLSRLEPATLYYFMIKNTDASGNETTSEAFDFTTLTVSSTETHSTVQPKDNQANTEAQSWLTPAMIVVSSIAGIGIFTVVVRALIVRHRP